MTFRVRRTSYSAPDRMRNATMSRAFAVVVHVGAAPPAQWNDPENPVIVRPPVASCTKWISISPLLFGAPLIATDVTLPVRVAMTRPALARAIVAAPVTFCPAPPRVKVRAVQSAGLLNVW